MKTVRFMALVAVVLAVVFIGGCVTPSSVRYWYEPQFSFAELKTYRWAETRSQTDPLLESNVRFLADGVLQTKGFAAKTDQADFIVSMRYGGSYAYELSALTLYVHVPRADKNELVWRGTATGSIKTDAASGDLKNAVEGILANFPPK